MGYPSKTAPGSNVGAIRFTSANPPVVQTEFQGLTVTRTGLGNFTITLNKQVDPNNRVVHVSRQGVAAAFAFERGPGSDSTIDILTTDLAGAAADTGDAVSVSIERTEVG